MCFARTAIFCIAAAASMLNTVAKHFMICKKKSSGNVLSRVVPICFTIYHVTVNPRCSTTTTGALRSGHSYIIKSK